MRCVLCLVLLLAACGGSSSETPPPLEPDPTAYRYTGPRLPGDEPAAAAPEPEPLEGDEDDLTPKKAAASTWGSGKPAPRATPSAAAPQPSAAPLTPPASAAPQPSSPATP